MRSFMENGETWTSPWSRNEIEHERVIESDWGRVLMRINCDRATASLPNTLQVALRLAMLSCLLLVSGQLFSADKNSQASYPADNMTAEPVAPPAATSTEIMDAALNALDATVRDDEYGAKFLRSRRDIPFQSVNSDQIGLFPRQTTVAGEEWNELISLPNVQVDYWQRYFLNGGRLRLMTAANKLGILRLPAEGIIERAGLPKNLIVVAFVESGFDPTAVSPKGATGLWQFMPATAARYGLEQGSWSDERMDFEKSTHAAAKYLADLHRFFGDWLLTLAAYNAGEEKVREAISKGGTHDFWALSRLGLLPRETQEYVPEVLGAVRAWGEAVGAEDSSLQSPTRGSLKDQTWVYAVAGVN